MDVNRTVSKAFAVAKCDLLAVQTLVLTISYDQILRRNENRYPSNQQEKKSWQHLMNREKLSRYMLSLLVSIKQYAYNQSLPTQHHQLYANTGLKMSSIRAWNKQETCRHSRTGYGLVQQMFQEEDCVNALFALLEMTCTDVCVCTPEENIIAQHEGMKFCWIAVLSLACSDLCPPGFLIMWWTHVCIDNTSSSSKC